MLVFDTSGFAIVGTDPKSADAATPEAYPRIRFLFFSLRSLGMPKISIIVIIEPL